MKTSPKAKRELDLKRMLREIDAIVGNDWGFEIDCHSLPNAKPFTQKEAKEMAAALMNIYTIAHCIHCTACQVEYHLPSKKRGWKAKI